MIKAVVLVPQAATPGAPLGRQNCPPSQGFGGALCLPTRHRGAAARTRPRSGCLRPCRPHPLRLWRRQSTRSPSGLRSRPLLSLRLWRCQPTGSSGSVIVISPMSWSNAAREEFATSMSASSQMSSSSSGSVIAVSLMSWSKTAREESATSRHASSPMSSSSTSGEMRPRGALRSADGYGIRGRVPRACRDSPADRVRRDLLAGASGCAPVRRRA